ncbi:MAG TPA: alpha/beta hydrolase [Gaiellaceae bacterium]
MKLHVHEWGDPGAPPLICLHGVTGHGKRFRRLAEEHWAQRFHVIAPDLRGHGRSNWEPPWTYPTYVDDLVETADALGIVEADWVGHSFGGRLVLELAAAHPERVRRAVLLDPAIHVLPHIALQNAEHQLADPVYASTEEYADRRADGPMTPRALVLEDAEQHCERLPDGRLRRRTCQPAIVSIYGEIATGPPPPETLRAPTLLIYAPAYGLVNEEQLAAYSGRAEIVEVPGMHMVMWDAFDEVAGAVDRFLT